MTFFKRIKEIGNDVIFRAKLRKERVAADLAIMIAKQGLRRKDVAQRMAVSEAALSLHLRGEANLTLDTIGAICDAASVDFDVVFRKAGSRRATSFWEDGDEMAGGEQAVLKDMSYLLERRRFHAPLKGYAHETHRSSASPAANDALVGKAKSTYEAEPVAA